MKNKKLGWDSEHWEYNCTGCTTPHNSFYKTVTTSKEWGKWVMYNEKKMKFDVYECMETNWFSPEHFKAFLKFCKKFND